MSEKLPDIPRKVLLVDDEENIVHALTRLLLEEDGLEVLGAVSGAQGLDLLRANPDVGVILSDQRMPGMTGVEFLQQAREVAPDAVRVVLTGYADMAATVDAINKGGASRYLTKPWDDELMLRTIQEGLEQHRLVLENRRLTELVARQNEELSEWNGNLKARILEQTGTIRRQNQELKDKNRQTGTACRDTLLAFSRLSLQLGADFCEHTGNVVLLATWAAEDLGLAPEQVDTIRIAAMLHGFGTPLEPPNGDQGEKREFLLREAARGLAALGEVEELQEAGRLIGHLRERYDGTGLPGALAGEKIPMGARIIAFVDFIDHAVAEERCEGAVDAALDRAVQERGHRFDPALFPLMEPHIRALYSWETEPVAEKEVAKMAEKELRPKQLIPGMLVTRDLYSATGVCLLEKGTILDSQRVASVASYYLVDAPRCGIHVSWTSDQPGMRAQELERENALKKRRSTELADEFRKAAGKFGR